ncbi:hypothetical protein Tco_0328413 [Tanacetum coccineum]
MPALVNKKLESLRSNFFWGCNADGTKIPWISWNSTLASKDKGGLGIGSLFSLNHALIQKWRWRFFHNPRALWVLVIKAIHGDHGIDYSFFIHVPVDNRVFGGRKGIDLDSLSCPIYDSSIETLNHTLWFCSLATSIWHKIFAWLDINIPCPSHIQDIFSWIGNIRVSASIKSILEVICGVALWHFRNELIFGSSPPKRCLLFDSIVDSSYRWGKQNPNVGVYLPESVFSHDQLYVALSRGISRTTTKVLVKPEKEFDQRGVYTSNVVYQEVLREE